MLTRSSLTLAGFFAAGVVAVVTHSLITRVEPVSEEAPRPLMTSQRVTGNTPPAPAPYDAADPASEPAPAQEPAAPAPTGMDKWLADATGEDAKARAHAISALARAPKETAFPVLKRVLSGGDPAVDRPLALASLQTIAHEQGDDDGRIKDALRQTVSHADDETFAEAAQRVLDTIP